MATQNRIRETHQIHQIGPLVMLKVPYLWLTNDDELPGIFVANSHVRLVTKQRIQPAMQWVFKPKQNSMEKTIDVLIDYEFKSVDNKICMIYPIISMNT
jgi:hypothetical protein